MAVDPTTGQTPLKDLLEFINPQQYAQAQAGQGQAGMQSQLANQMMSAGYVPNSGGFGAIAQMLQAGMGAYLANKAQEDSAGLYQKQLEALSAAQKAKAESDKQDIAYKTNEEIRKAAGIGDANEQTKLKYAPQESDAEAKAAAAKAQATLPVELQKLDAETQGKIKAAVAAAEVSIRRGYIVSDASGNQHVITPQGKEIYQATSPGGGKLTPNQTALNQADVNNLEKLNIRQASAAQLQSNLVNWVANYTGQDPKTLQGKSPQELADTVKGVGALGALSQLNPLGHRGLDAISQDIAINAAGTKQTAPTEEVVKAERNNTVSRYKTPTENATIILNHANDIRELQKQLEDTNARINSRQAPQQGAVPQATPGPTNPGQHYVYDPATGTLKLQ